MKKKKNYIRREEFSTSPTDFASVSVLHLVNNRQQSKNKKSPFYRIGFVSVFVAGRTQGYVTCSILDDQFPILQKHICKVLSSLDICIYSGHSQFTE